VLERCHFLTSFYLGIDTVSFHLHALQQDGLLTKASKNAGTRLEQQGLFLLPVMAADQVVNKAQEGSSMETIQEVQNQIANKTSRMLANRALDELARTPPRPPPQHASM
jgi:hypothetical protein